MSIDIRTVKDMNGLIAYLAEKLEWKIDLDDFEDIEDITYDFSAADIGLKEEAFAKITSLRQLPPLVDGQKWGIFCVEFDSKRFEITALRKILSGLIPKRRNSAEHAVWKQKDLLFICFWGNDNDRTIGLAHFEDADAGLPQIKMISCCPAVEDFTQIGVFENRLKNLKWPANYLDYERWQSDWSSAFVTGYRQTIKDASTLTVQLATEAQEIKKRILAILDIETSNGYVHLLYEKFKETLIHDMPESQFADMYAQTIVYGLFSARCMDKTPNDFSAQEAIELIPNTNPFLKSLMKECLGSQNNSKLSFDELEVGNVVDLLLHTKTDAIIQDFNRQTGGGREDPVIHFYEEFLTAYDKSQKVQRGVFYTPQPVVKFIVNAVDSIIKNEFGYAGGLASTDNKTIKYIRDSKRTINGNRTKVEDTKEVPAIQILDPATGTGTFLRETILRIYENFKNKNRNVSPEELKNKWNSYVPEYLLPRINGFELMMAPYAVAHMKLAMVLKDTGYDFNSNERLRVYLTNTLEEPGNSNGQLALWDDPLASESIAANQVKKNEGINIVIGNPPYSCESVNKGDWILSLMDLYKKEADGITKLQEKNSKPLNDDYVKFICYSQHLLKKSNQGILAFINPHGFIDGPIFRGMRAALLQTFDKIYIIDLHGNANRQEKCHDGSKDENVFDIKQGVCILILVKNNLNIKNKQAKLYHSDIYGLRENKYDTLSGRTLEDLEFEEIFPSAPNCLFKKVNTELFDEYKEGFSINDLFILGANGIKTARDDFNLCKDRHELYERLDRFRKLPVENARSEYNLGNDVNDWKVSSAQHDINNNAVINDTLCEDKIIKIMYRVFDDRWMLYTGQSRGIISRPRTEVTDQFIFGNNIALATGRTNKFPTCDHFLCVDKMVEMKAAERSTCTCVFPLYTYYQFDEKYLKQVNFNKDIVDRLARELSLIYHPEYLDQKDELSITEKDVFSYMYAILYSNSYRNKYTEFIKSDFPRIPYIKDKAIFWSLVRLGNQLIDLHLIKSESLLAQSCNFVDNGRLVEKVYWKNNRIYINKHSYFENIDEHDWTFLIGGYPPLQYWYRERKDIMLSEEEIVHYRAIVTVIKKTRVIMEEIDLVIHF